MSLASIKDHSSCLFSILPLLAFQLDCSPSKLSASNMFKYVCLSLSLFLALNGNLVQGTPTGAPLIACADMTPQHGVGPQNTTSPFGTTPSSVRIFISEAIRHSVAIDLI